MLHWSACDRVSRPVDRRGFAICWHEAHPTTEQNSASARLTRALKKVAVPVLPVTTRLTTLVTLAVTCEVTDGWGNARTEMSRGFIARTGPA